MEFSTLNQYIKNNEKNIIKMLVDLVKHESPSTDSESLMKICNHLKDILDEFIDSRTEIIGKREAPILHSTVGDGEREILFLGHLDTVWPIGTLKNMPLKVENNVIKGPGTFDMKAGIVQCIWSLKTLQLFNWPPNLKVHLLFTTDEETGSLYSRSVIEKFAQKCESVFVFEPSQEGENEGALKTGRKGVGIYHIKIKGLASHAGVNFTKGQNAALEAAHQTVYLSSLTDLTKGTTINVGKIHSGTRANIVPDEASISVDVRFKTKHEGERIHQKILNLSAINPLCNITITGGINRPCMELNKQSEKLLEIAIEVGKNLGFQVKHVSTGGASDGNFTAGLGVPTLDGLGAVGEGAHAPNERIIISKMLERINLTTGMLYKLSLVPVM